MEFVLMAAALAVFAVYVFTLEAYRAKKAEKKFIRELYENYEKLSDKKYAAERYEKLNSYFLRHGAAAQIDDITWNDLGMDEVYKRMNYTMSASGEEYLYYTLRTLRQSEEELEHFERIVAFFGEHPDERVRFQYRMHKLGHTGKYSLYDYIDNLDNLGQRSNVKNLVCDLLFLPLIGLLWVNFSLGILGIAALMIYNIISYFREKGEIDPYITSFAYIMRLMEACGELEKMPLAACGEELEQLRVHRRRLQSMRRNSFLVMAGGGGGTAVSSGNILEALLDYVRMVFHVDLIKFNNMLKVVRGNIGDVDGLIGIVGYLETAVAVWIFRESLKDGWCVPEFTDRECVELQDGYHPLLRAPVKNSILAEKGVLLTGSNASGKSTFLKTVALNAILAQTVNTCAAERYRGAFFYVYSSMTLRDDMNSGESYYIVEIKALKRILDASASGKRPVLCFVDEVLRGTNTVERIAASNQILRSLGGSGILCFAATHDIELTDLLEEDFDNYHFEEEIRDGDVCFNYKLQCGKAVTRNAIRLLELMGYDREIIERASVQAEHFLATGYWKMA